MTDIKLDEDFQPDFTGNGDYRELDGVSEIHQSIRLSAKSRLYGIVARYKEEDIENKIRLTIQRIVREFDEIESVQEITIERVFPDKDSDKNSGYRVYIGYNDSEVFEDIIRPT